MQASQYTSAPCSSPAVPAYATGSQQQQQSACVAPPQPGSGGAEVEQVAILGYN